LTPGSTIEAEIVNTNIRTTHGFFIISISRLLQIDIRRDITAKAQANDTFIVVPTEANL
jgi:hypothetical protein